MLSLLPRPTRLRSSLLLTLLLLALRVPAQSLTQAGLRSINGQGRFRALKADTAGNLYTLLDAADGVRVVKMDADATTVLAEAHLGQAGDQGVSLALDATGAVYVAGTSLSTGSISGTAGTSYPARTDSTTNSFVAKFTPALTEQWLTFLGSGRMAVTAVDASATQATVTGSIFAATLPVTPNGIQQQPLPGSNANGFVESFDAATGTLRYSTYLSGANGDTAPAGIALDASGNAYVVGNTTASGFPTINALVPRLLNDQSSPVSGFLTKLTSAGDGFVFSTFVPGSGLDSVAVNTATSTVLLSGNIAPGLFPLTEVRAPIAANVTYQAAVRIAQDGSAVLSTTLLAPGDSSTIAASAIGFVAGVGAGTANVSPLLPLGSLQPEGSAFLLVGDGNGAVQRTARVGGIPVNHAGFSSLPASTGGVLVAADGSALFAGGIAPTLSSALLGTQRFDVTLGPAATAALPSTVRDALPSASCNGSACAGSAAVLARLAATGGASLLLSVDDLPNITLRNAGATQANGVQVSANGYSVVGTTCNGSLPAGSECDIALAGSGPGSITATAGNAAPATASLPATNLTADSLSITPKQLDFGITSAATTRARTLTVANLAATPQTFASQAGLTSSLFTVSQSASTCTAAGDGLNFTVAVGASCTITLQLAASGDATNDGNVRATWIVGPRELTLTGYTQADALTLSATHLGFGRVFAGGLRSPRYLYLSNGSDAAQSHAAVALSPDLPFTLTDGCPSTLAPQSVCQITVNYASSVVPSSDATTISVDGIAMLIDGQTVPQPSVNGSSVNPNLAVSPASVSFSQPVVVTTVSGETQSVLIRNTGASAFPLDVAVTGDFTASDCPASLAGGESCTVTLRFTPADAGTRQGLLSVAAGSSSPVYVTLQGAATAFLPVNGLVEFGQVPVQTPSVQWFRVSQPFASLTVASSTADYGVLLVEDQGYGYGSPDRTRFQQSVTGSCLSCYLGVQFLPSQAGVESANLSIHSTNGGGSQTVALMGTGVPPSGVLLSPASHDFSSVPVGSSTGAQVFTLTNATGAAITTAAPGVTGDFAISAAATGGTACGGVLQAGESCTVAVQFGPSTTGPRSGTFGVTTSAGLATAALTGYGDADPGLTFQPASLYFRNVPGTQGTQQSVTLTNTGNLTATVGTPSVSDSHFAVNGTCGSLSPGAQCTLTVTYAPGDSLAGGLLTVPVTTAPGGAAQTTQYTLALSALYTAESAGLEIVPGQEISVNYGALATGSVTSVRMFRVNNLSGKSLTLSLEAPRQFPMTATNCAGLAPGGSCTVSLAYAPLLNADATGTLFMQGQPTDGTATVNGLAYLQGYGSGTGTLAVAGDFTAAGVIDFGQVASGQSATETLTLVNQSATATVTVRRIRAEFPFQATSDCGTSLAPNASCTVVLTYAPNSQTTVGGNAGSQSQTGVLTLESDAENSPLLVDLAGRTVPVQSNGPAPEAPLAVLTTSQGALTFASSTVGSGSVQQTVVVTNTGTVALRISGVVTSPDFSATGNCGALAVGASCQTSVAFTPQTAGTRSGALEIRSNASNALEYVSLLGIGTPASVTLAPSSLAFGRVLVGKPSASQVATFTNTGTSSVTLGAITISGDFATAGAAPSGSPCITGSAVAPGASCAVAILFTPSQTGTRAGTLSVASSATPLPLSVALSGIGVQPQLAVTPSTLNFGDVLLGKTQTLALTLSNVSAAAVDALQIGISSGDFSATATCGPVTLSAGSSCSLNVLFAPTVPGIRNGTLTISSSDPASPLVVPLTGNGVQAGSFTLTVNGEASGSATVPYGIPASYALALTPVNGFTGAVALTCTPKSVIQYTACSIAPSTVTLANGSVSATATISTVSAVNSSALRPNGDWRAAVLCATPMLLLTGIRRRRLRTMLLLAAGLFAVLLSGGCGSGVKGDTRIRYAAPGTYQFTITAASTTGITAQQTVPVTLTITNSPK
ncbi:choice-of-anchor D domain-containing protein [Terriglobus sp.]|uniref:choice-of-anchor D domain-containing protein n=1 Tax=Terriglobus sp. TaxID=1889013 RepID=UPI003B00E280